MTARYSLYNLRLELLLSVSSSGDLIQNKTKVKLKILNWSMKSRDNNNVTIKQLIENLRIKFSNYIKTKRYFQKYWITIIRTGTAFLFLKLNFTGDKSWQDRESVLFTRWPSGLFRAIMLQFCYNWSAENANWLVTSPLLSSLVIYPGCQKTRSRGIFVLIWAKRGLWINLVLPIYYFCNNVTIWQ